MFVPCTALTVAIRREILSVLAGSAAMTLPAATAEVARGWSTRRRLHGESPSSVAAAEAIVFQVGAELAEEIAAHRAAEDRKQPGRRARTTQGSLGAPLPARSGPSLGPVTSA